MLSRDETNTNFIVFGLNRSDWLVGIKHQLQLYHSVSKVYKLISLTRRPLEVRHLCGSTNLDIWVILRQLFQIPRFVSMKGNFVTNGSLCTVLKLTILETELSGWQVVLSEIYFFYVFYSCVGGIFVFTVTIPYTHMFLLFLQHRL